jgi:TonB-linked SusC/RagA family outer membrane protein
MKTKLHVLLTLLFALMMQISFAQERTVSGTVIDEGGMPIPGVNIVVKGTTTNVQTDFDGKFQIQAAPQQTLVFTYIGMATTEVSAASATVNVTMKDQATELEGVVVTAVGIRREKASIGAATTTVRSDEIMKGAQSNLNDALKGKVAGVIISNASTDPGASSGVIIRGFSSLTGNNQPLYVVDGIPINNVTNYSDNLSGGYDFGRGTGDLNPNDIESLTVLKGASATALYGSRAANGVIMITTKKGQQGKLAVDFSTTTFFTSILRTPKYQNQFGQGWDGQSSLLENGSWGPRFDGQPRVWGHVVNNSQLIKPYSFQEDQLENFFDTGTSVVNTLAVSGGSGDSTVRLSYSNTQQDGIYPTDADAFERNTIGLSGTTKVKGVTLSGNMNYINTGGSSVATGQGPTVYNNLMQIPTDIPITEFADYKGPFHNISNYYTPYGITNPYFSLNENGSDYNKERFYGSLEVSSEINKWSSFSYRFGIDQQTDYLRIWTAELAPIPGSPNSGQIDAEGTYGESSNMVKQINHDLLYNLNFDLFDKVALASSFGFNSNTRTTNFFSAAVGSQDIAGFYSLANSGDAPTIGTLRTDRRLYGLYNSSTLSYDDMLYLTGNIRNDWYSTLPRENRSVLYGGVNGSWIVSNTFPGIKSVANYLKLRAGYGETGVDTDPYQVLPVFTSTNIDNQGFASLDFPFGGLNAFGVGNRAGNANLKPERRKEIELGLEASFFNGRITLDATVYKAKVINQILPLPLAASSGYTSQTANVGTISNEGIEALLTVQLIKNNNDGFNWSTSVNFAKNNSVLESLDPRIQQVELGGLNSITYVARPGQPIGLIVGPVAQRDGNGNIIVDANGIPIETTDQHVYGDTQYDYTMGIGNILKWKGITLDFTFDIRQGGLMFSRTADVTRFTGNSITTTYNDRQPFVVPGSVVANGTDGDGNTIYVPNTTPVDSEHMDDYYSAVAMSRQTVIDKSFIKLREVILSYTLPSKYFDNTFIDGITISAIGRNLFLWTPRNNQYIDPEVSTFGTDIAGQFGEFSANPSTRSIGFSIRANF